MEARFARRGDDALGARLASRGYACVDDFLERDTADAMRRELERLADARDANETGRGGGRKYLRPNRTKFGDEHLFGKPNIYECDMHDDGTLAETKRDAAYATIWEFFRATERGMADAFRRVIPEIALRDGPDSRTVKLQVNEGRGACFPWHYDNPGAPSNRALTCILYLNPDWKPGDGGELRLQPFCGVAATIQPKHNRLAIFFSDRTLHRVTPSTAAKRYAVTVWLDGDFVDPRTGASTNASELNLNAREALSDIAKTAKELARGNAQRALSRAVYADEYEASLVECMGNARGADEMLQAHYEHCRSVKKNHALKTLVDALRDYRREVEASAAEVEL